MRVLGLVFAGTATTQRAEMVECLRDTLGLKQITDASVEADLFELPDGSRFAVAGIGGMGETCRSIGFLVSDLDEAVARLHAGGIDVDEPASNDRHRYVHFRAPDGHLYELVELLPQPSGVDGRTSASADGTKE